MAGGRVSFSAIPAKLRERDRWVVWRWESDPNNPDKRRKPPYCVADPSRHASSTKPETWAPFEQAVAVVEAGQADGIGYAMQPPEVFVDLDAELPEADRWAIAAKLDSYTETSPSGAGLHTLIVANLNGGRHPQGIGVFQTGRWCYFTGDHVAGTPTTIEERQAELDEVLAHFLPDGQTALCPNGTRVVVPVALDDQAVLEKARTAKNGAGHRFEALWNGDTSAYDDDDSRADLALCSMLAWWTNRDPDRVDRMFRASALMRDKWEREELPGADDRGGDRRDNSETSFSHPPGTSEHRMASNPSLLEERGVLSDFPGGLCLGDVFDAFGELLVMPDPGAVEVALAASSPTTRGDAVWPLLVGPPGCGKSEIVSALTGRPRVAAVEPDAADAPLGVRAEGQGQGPAGVDAAADRRVRDPRVQGPDDGAVDAPGGAGADHRPAARGRRRPDREVVRERAARRVGGQARPDRRRHAGHRRAARLPRGDGRAVRALPDARGYSAGDRPAVAGAARPRGRAPGAHPRPGRRVPRASSGTSDGSSSRSSSPSR